MDLWAVQKRKIIAKPKRWGGRTSRLPIDSSKHTRFSRYEMVSKLLPHYLYGVFGSKMGSTKKYDELRRG